MFTDITFQINALTVTKWRILEGYACRMQYGNKNAHQQLLETLKEAGKLRRHMGQWENDIKTNLRYTDFYKNDYE